MQSIKGNVIGDGAVVGNNNRVKRVRTEIDTPRRKGDNIVLTGHGVTGKRIGNETAHHGRTEINSCGRGASGSGSMYYETGGGRFHVSGVIGSVIGSNIRNVTINGKPVSDYDIPEDELDEFTIVTKKGSYVIKEKAIQINITADHVDKVNLTSGDVTVHGDVKTVQCTTGDISITGNVSSASSTSGDITCHGRVNSISTISGDVYT